MAFIMKGFPFNVDNTPVYNMDLEEGVMGIADENGSILINKNITNEQEREEVITHEKVHLDQMKRGDLSYDDDSVTWKGKKYPRENFLDGDETLPWEKEAYNV
jgi:hypothetical protein|tara:strand:- start:813 stop:1121 length:309 start_codon:yes stop_codon:yes gene_type:complete